MESRFLTYNWTDSQVTDFPQVVWELCEFEWIALSTNPIKKLIKNMEIHLKTYKNVINSNSSSIPYDIILTGRNATHIWFSPVTTVRYLSKSQLYKTARNKVWLTSSMAVKILLQIDQHSTNICERGINLYFPWNFFFRKGSP